MKTFYRLNDTFNNCELSRHTTIAKAIEARDAHQRAVKRANGRDAFLTYSITHFDGTPIDKHLLDHQEWLAYQKKNALMISDKLSDIVWHLGQASNKLATARDQAPADSDLREMIEDVDAQVENIALRICGYKFNDAGEHIDTSEVRMN